MASSSSFTSLLPPLIFLLAVNFLLPLASCGNISKRKYLSKCDNTNDQNYVATEQIKLILSILKSWTPINRFFSINLNTSVYGLAWCNLDYDPSACERCMADAITIIKEDYSDKKIVGAYYMEVICYLRFNMIDFRGKLDTSIGLFSQSLYHVKHLDFIDAYESNMMKLFDKLIKTMKEKQPKNMYAQNHENIFKFDKFKLDEYLVARVFVTVQCSRDLDFVECNSCLGQAINDLKEHCGDYIECKIIYGSCLCHYEVKEYNY